MNDPPPPAGRPWWEGAVFYQIYPRSFRDSPPTEWSPERRDAFRATYPGRTLGDDGVGDLDGIRRSLPYLARLGVDVLWLSPFYPSPMADCGYDISDYCDVDPLFGALGEARRLVTEAHEQGLRLIVDLVPNHTSAAHPWFVDARSSRTSGHRDWYVWRDRHDAQSGGKDPGPPPNNWTAALTHGPAWTWETATGQWYLHLFLAAQPDLNWANPAVAEAMSGVLRFWLDLGVDGFRIDVAHGLGKDPALPDDPPALAGTDHASIHDDPLTHPILRRLRTLADSYAGDRVLVGEVFLPTTAQVAAYYGCGDELHLAFNFAGLFAPWASEAWRRIIDDVGIELGRRHAWPTWVLSNHDNPRHRTRYGSAARARAAVLLLLGLRGTPFLYAGEELGLGDAEVPPGCTLDPGGRDPCRAPIPWEPGPRHGWATPRPWLPWPPDADSADALRQAADPSSFLSLYRSALAARRRSPALRLGSFTWRESPLGVLVWERRLGDDHVVVVVNFTDADVAIGGLGDYGVELASGDPIMSGFRGHVPASSAVWLRPPLPRA